MATPEAKPYPEVSPRAQKMLDEEIDMLFEGTTNWHCRKCSGETPTVGLLVTEEGLPVCPTEGCGGAGWSELQPVGHVYRTTA
jgi:hypothetical protein